MGACGSSEKGGGTAVNEEEVRTSRGIDRMLRDEEKRLAREVKVSAAARARSRVLPEHRRD